ncbi:MAG: hypothetical protein ACI4UT_04625, partial [Candidatus Enteromonas sp.]
KLLLIERAAAQGTPVISCMGTGNKLDPGRFEITDITKTSVCPLAKVMRRELKKRGIFRCKVLYSREEPVKISASAETKGNTGRPVPGSIAFVPGTAGLMEAMGRAGEGDASPLFCCRMRAHACRKGGFP